MARYLDKAQVPERYGGRVSGEQKKPYPGRV